MYPQQKCDYSALYPQARTCIYTGHACRHLPSEVPWISKDRLLRTGFTWVRLQQPREQHYLFLPVSAGFLWVQTMVWSQCLRFFYVRTDVDACDCTWGLYKHHNKVSLKADSGRKIPCLIGELNLHWYCAWLFSPTAMLY